ncbi:MAG: sugar ABC transporter permease, partial [Cyanobacteria bacterium]|nr:sugar ABC transporter permease [Cyanobacteriota bacterium]
MKHLRTHTLAIEPKSQNPAIAAALSVIPGLGQIYNLEPRKGVLFLLVGLSNLSIITSLLFIRPLLT